MDPLSITAAAVAFVTAANSISKTVKKIYRAPEEVRNAAASIASFKQYISLVSIAVGRRAKSFENLQQEEQYVFKTLSSASSKVQQLEAIIKSSLLPDGDEKLSAVNLKDRIIWSRQKRKVVEIVRSLEEDRSNLMALLPAILLLSLDEMRDWTGMTVAVAGEIKHEPSITPSSSAKNHPSTEPSIDLVLPAQTITTEPWDELRCQCSCHQRTLLRIGSRTSALFGNVLMVFTNTWHEQCDEIRCQKRCGQELKIHYQFPLEVWSHMLRVTWALRWPMGFLFNLQVSPVRHYDDIVFKLVIRDGAKYLQRLFRDGKASLYDTMPNGNTLLDVAFLMHDWETAGMLIDQGAPMEGSNEENGNPLQWATEEFLRYSRIGFPNKTAEQVLRKAVGTHIEESEFTRLHRTVLGMSKLSLSDLLADHTRDINKPDSAGRTPLWWAALLRDEAMMAMLLDYGADPNLTSSTGGGLLLPVQHNPPSEKTLGFSSDMVRRLLDAGYNINQSSYGGHTPLMVAVTYDDIDLIRLYLEHGADVHAKSRRGQNMIHLAAFFDPEGRITQELINHGADDLVENDLGFLPISFTFVLGNAGSLAVLLKQHPIRELSVFQQDILLSRAFEVPYPTMLAMLLRQCWAKAADRGIFHLSDVTGAIWTEPVGLTLVEDLSEEVADAIDRLRTKVQRCRSVSLLLNEPTSGSICEFCMQEMEEQSHDEVLQEFHDAQEYI